MLQKSSEVNINFDPIQFISQPDSPIVKVYPSSGSDIYFQVHNKFLRPDCLKVNHFLMFSYMAFCLEHHNGKLFNYNRAEQLLQIPKATFRRHIKTIQNFKLLARKELYPYNKAKFKHPLKQIRMLCSGLQIEKFKMMQAFLCNRPFKSKFLIHKNFIPAILEWIFYKRNFRFVQRQFKEWKSKNPKY